MLFDQFRAAAQFVLSAPVQNAGRGSGCGNTQTQRNQRQHESERVALGHEDDPRKIRPSGRAAKDKPAHGPIHGAARFLARGERALEAGRRVSVPEARQKTAPGVSPG
jgi:hypothetical protein